MTENKEEFQHLTDQCGHHCGALKTGKHMAVGHCSCSECHAGMAPILPLVKR